MKAYTDMSQSKKLVEILPRETSDMFYWCGEDIRFGGYKAQDKDYDIPCWSLAALLNVLPKIYYPVKDHKTDLILGKPKDKWCVLYWDTTGMQHGEETLGDNPVDACVDMILRLKEKKCIMKELSTEEKAKRYAEALKQIKECTPDENGFVTIYPDEIFPELKESEDEKIRKEIIKLVKFFYGSSLVCKHTISKDKMVAWLEKQGEQKPAEWHIEDEQNLNACLGHIPDEFLRRWLKDVIHTKYDKSVDKLKAKFHKERKDERISWLNSLEDRFNNQESNKDHWQEVRERAAIAAMQGYMSCKCQLVGTINLAMAEGIAEQAILIADVLVKKLKGE